MDGPRLAEAYADAAEIPNLYSLLVVRHGALVAEQYFGTPTRATATSTASIGKSILSALVGIALQEGLLVDLDERMIDFFPEYDVAELDPRKRQITIGHLVRMTAGYPFDGTAEFFDSATSSPDWMRFCVVDWPLERAPGEGWAYSNASTHVLSGILTKASGRSLLELANRYLFSRFGQRIERWPVDPQGYCWGIGWVDCTPLQLASFGQLVLDRGMWRGRPTLDPDWLAASLEAITATPGESGSEHFENCHYGYLWWHAEVDGHEVSYASGYGGQLIVIVPDLDMVIVTTAYDVGDDFSDAPAQVERAIMDLVATEVIPAAN